MNDMLAQSLHGIGPHFVYFILALAISALFVAIYIRVTPYRELTLIRQGNRAAAISLGGALIGFALPLARAVAQSTSLADLLIWSAVALVAQLLGFFMTRLLLRGLAEDIHNDRPAPAILLAAIAVSIGLLNAAAMTE